jgi:hypothetical protein
MLNLCKIWNKKNQLFRNSLRKRFRVDNFIKFCVFLKEYWHTKKNKVHLLHNYKYQKN